MAIKKITANQLALIIRIKSACSWLIIFFFVLFAHNNIFAQDRGVLPPGYFIDTESGETKFIQRLVWRGGANTYRYQVVLERMVNGRYVSYIREFSTALFIEVSLPPGEYRFQVIPYDIFDMPGTPSAWMRIEVRHALQPEPLETIPEILTGDDGEELGLKLNITGINLHPEADFFLLHPDNTRTPLDILEADTDGNIKIFIESSVLASGDYAVIVRNPGGLEARVEKAAFSIVNNNFIMDSLPRPEQKPEIDPEPEPEHEIVPELEPEPEIEHESEPEFETETEEQKISSLKNVLIKISASWMPVLPLYGYEFGEDFHLVGANVRFSAIFRIPANAFFGPELTSYWFDNALYAGLNLLTEKWFPKERLALGVRAGILYPIMTFDTFDILFSADSLQEQLIINLGANLALRITNRFLFEAGVNYMHIFGDTPSGNMAPWIGLGLQF